MKRVKIIPWIVGCMYFGKRAQGKSDLTFRDIFVIYTTRKHRDLGTDVYNYKTLLFVNN